jgi:hypothetical protein
VRGGSSLSAATGSPACVRTWLHTVVERCWEEALAAARAAVRANPCAADVRQTCADVLTHAGDPVAAESEDPPRTFPQSVPPPELAGTARACTVRCGPPRGSACRIALLCRENAGLRTRLPRAGRCGGRNRPGRGSPRDSWSAVANNPSLTVRSACGCLFFRNPVPHRFSHRWHAGRLSGDRRQRALVSRDFSEISDHDHDMQYGPVVCSCCRRYPPRSLA